MIKILFNKILNIVEIKNKTILEIGPGTGNLTTNFKKNPKKLIVIEKDKKLVELLKENFGLKLK